MRKNLPPLPTAGHAEVDGVFSRFYAAASKIQHSAGVCKWRSCVFGFFDLSRDADGCQGAEGRTARLRRTLLGKTS